MTPPSPSRRSVLRTGGTLGAVLATGSLAGCVDSLGDLGGTGDGTGSNPLGPVPSSADAVATIDVDTFLDDEAVRSAYDAFLDVRAQSEDYDGPETLAATLEEFASSEGFDPRDLDRAVLFSSYTEGGNAGATDDTAFVFEGNWDESDVLTLVGADGEYTETSDGDYTLYEPPDEYGETVGVLDDGRYVVGGTAPMKAAIDVDRGESDPIDGPVADTYGSTTAGPIRFAARVEQSWFPEDVEGEDGTIDLSPVRAIEAVSGALYRNGTTRGVRLRLHAPDEGTAVDLEETVHALVALAESQSSQSDGAAMPTYLENLLTAVTVERSGAAVVVSVERTVTELEGMASDIGELASGASGSAGSNTSAESPAVNFEFEYAADPGTVTITHTAGDTVAADELLVDGEGFADADGADMTEPGPWGGRTGEDGQISAGDSVVVGVRSDCVLRLVWQREDHAVTLADYAGPDV